MVLMSEKEITCVLGYSLNIIGTEWIIIIFLGLILILGTNQLPAAARKLGRAVSEYNNAKNEFQNQMKDYSNHTVNVTNPVQNEKQKLESIAKSLGINPVGKSEEELRKIISGKIGKPRQDESENQ